VLHLAVRYGRVPKRSLSVDDQPVSTTPEMPDPLSSLPAECIVVTPIPDDTVATSTLLVAPVSSSLTENDNKHGSLKIIKDANFDVIVSVSHSHTVHCDLTEDKVTAMAKRPSTLVCPV